MKRVLIILICLVVASFQASGQTFSVGWFDWFPDSPVSDVAGTGSKDIVAYNHDSIVDQVLEDYLDSAAAAGMQVILDVRFWSHNGVAMATNLENLSATYGSHPALKGWYTADEPYLSGVAPSSFQAAYDALKLNCDKPVYMAFNTSDILYNFDSTLQNAHDVGMYLDYRISIGDPEFDVIKMEAWKGWMDDGSSQSSALGKTFMTVLPAYGQNPNYPTWSARLLTKGEIRFQANYSILAADAEGVYFWGHDITQQAVADPSLPYPHDGPQWLEDVGNPLSEELTRYGKAIDAGSIAAGVFDNKADINSKVYQDPETGQYYLLSVNENTGSESATFTLNLPVQFTFALPLYEDGAPVISIASGQFSDSFGDYGVHNYALLKEPPTTRIWFNVTSGDWNGATNWSIFSSPNANTHTAVFGSVITTGQTVYTNSAVTVKKIQFDNANAYAIAGVGSVHIEADTGNATLEVLQGNHQFQVVVNLNSDTDAIIATGASLGFNNELNLNGYTLDKTGDGEMKINNVLNTGGGTVLAMEGIISGSGMIAGDLINISATVAPGNSPGELEVSGNFSQGIAGTLEIELTGTGLGEFDVLTVGGTAMLGGTLSVLELEGFAANPGVDEWIILTAGNISGTFDSFVGDGFGCRIVDGTDLVLAALLDGDANSDGVVSAGDYSSVQSSFGNVSTMILDGDANGDGVVSAGDYSCVQSSFGSMAGGVAPVPEPATLALLSIGGLSALIKHGSK